MRPDEDPKVRAIYQAAHPGWPERSRLWNYVHPTLVVEDEGALLGFTSYSVGPDELGYVCYGVDVAILPRFQGQGYGRRLADERLRYGRDVGCDRFIGATQPDNIAMRTIFEAQGFEELPLQIGNAFPRGTPAILYGGSIQI